MRSLVNKEFHRMIVDVHFEDEVGKSAGLDLAPHDAVVVGVDQGLVQVEHQHLPPDQVEAVSGDGGQRGELLLDGSVSPRLSVIVRRFNLEKLLTITYRSDLFLEDKRKTIPNFRDEEQTVFYCHLERFPHDVRFILMLGCLIIYKRRILTY